MFCATKFTVERTEDLIMLYMKKFLGCNFNIQQLFFVKSLFSREFPLLEFQVLHSSQFLRGADNPFQLSHDCLHLSSNWTLLTETIPEVTFCYLNLFLRITFITRPVRNKSVP